MDAKFHNVRYMLFNAILFSRLRESDEREKE